MKRAVLTSSDVWCGVGLARALFPRFRWVWRPTVFSSLQIENPIFLLKRVSSFFTDLTHSYNSNWANPRPVSSVGIAPVCWAGGPGSNPSRTTNQSLYKKMVKSCWLCLKSCLSSDDCVIGRWRWAVSLVSFILDELEGDVKEPTLLFEKTIRTRLSSHPRHIHNHHNLKYVYVYMHISQSFLS